MNQGQETQTKPTTPHPHSILVVFLSFWITVLLVRGIIYFLVRRGIIPAIFVSGFHIHHFITGFLLLIVAIVLTRKKIWLRYVPLALLGCGLALICDELLFWTRGHFDYWSIVNFFGVAIIGLVLAGYYQYHKIKTAAVKLPLKKEVIQTALVVLPVLLAVLLMFNWFSYYNPHAANAANRLLPTRFHRPTTLTTQAQAENQTP